MRPTRTAVVALIAALAALLGATSSASAQLPIAVPAPPTLPPLPLPPLPPLPGLPGLPGLPTAPVGVPPGSPATLQIFADQDPVEDRGFPFVVSYTRPDAQPPTQRVVVKTKPATAGAGCADKASDDPGMLSLDVPTPGDSDRTIDNAILVTDPGRYVVCGWLQDPPDGSPALARDGGTFTAREPRSSFSIQAPSVSYTDTIPVTMTGTAEVGRPVTVLLRPQAGVPCGATEQAERANGGGAVIQGTISGDTTLTGIAAARVVPGPYLLCGYVAEGTDQPPESTASATIQVAGPSPCAAAQALLPGPQATADSAAAAAAFRARLITAAKDRVVLAQRAAKKARTRRGKRVRASRLRAAQAVVTEQTRYATGANAQSAAAQAALAQARAAAAQACA